MIKYDSIRYEAQMEDAVHDGFTIKAWAGDVSLSDLDDGLAPEERCANLLFDPAGAVALAMHLIKAASVALYQTREG